MHYKSEQIFKKVNSLCYALNYSAAEEILMSSYFSEENLVDQSQLLNFYKATNLRKYEHACRLLSGPKKLNLEKFVSELELLGQKERKVRQTSIDTKLINTLLRKYKVKDYAGVLALVEDLDPSQLSGLPIKPIVKSYQAAGALGNLYPILQHIVSVDNSNADACFYLAITEFNKSNYGEAIKIFRRIGSNSNHASETLKYLMIASYKVGSIKHAHGFAKALSKILSKESILKVGLFASEQDCLSLSISLLKEFLDLDPSNRSADVCNDLAAYYLHTNQLVEARSVLIKGFNINPGNAAILQNITTILNLGEMPLEVYSALIKNSAVRPENVIKPIMKLLGFEKFISPSYVITDRHDKLIDDIFIMKNIEMLFELLSNAIVTDLNIEKLLIEIRRGILFSAEDKLSGKEHVIDLLCCYFWNTEFIVAPSSDEEKYLKTLNEPQNYFEEMIHYLKLALYGKFNDNMATITNSHPFSKTKIFERSVTDKDKERGLEKQIFSFTPTSMKSSHVRLQYEENPYPVWQSAQISLTRHTICNFLTRLSGVTIDPEYLELKKDKKDVLIAGCGTGRHPIEFYSRVSDVNLTAIDLSKSSLAYAKRKALEVGFDDIKFAQGDILKVGDLRASFDYIECVGVLHHLVDPAAGLDALLSVLHPKGIIRLGLYSARARSSILKFREHTQSGLKEFSKDELRKERVKILENTYGHMLSGFLSNFTDFYSTSEFHDLLFNKQEKNYEQSEVLTLLEDHGLKFCGFKVPLVLLKAFKESYPQDNSHTSINLWFEFEKDNPSIFIGMYDFYCQKL